jgi:RecA-family ATPase
LAHGKLTTLDGDPGTSKSTMTSADWAARITTGSPWPDGAPCEIGNVLVLSAEDAVDDTIRPRAEAAGANLERLHVLSGIDMGDELRPFSIPGDLSYLEREITDRSISLVVIDVLSAYLAGKVDSYRDQDVRGALMPMARMAERTGAAFLAIRHLNKSSGTNALYRGGGSIGIIGAARVGLLVARDPDDEHRRILAVVKNNLAPIAPSLAYRVVSDEEFDCARIEWDGTTEHRANDLLAIESDEDRTERDDAADWLRDLLADGAMPASEVKTLARKVGHAERTLTRARNRIGAKTRRDGFGKGAVYVWYMPATEEPM